MSSLQGIAQFQKTREAAPDLAGIRLLHVVATAQRRGAEVFASDLIRALDRSGIGQRVAIIRDRGTAPLDYPAQTTSLRSREWKVPGLRADLGAMLALRRVLTTWRPHLIQAHGGEPYKYSLLAGGAPVVYRRIGWVNPRITRGPSRGAYGWMMRRAARVVAVAEAIRLETIETFGVSPNKVVTIHQGTDPDRLIPARTSAEVRKGLGIIADAPVTISLGALSPEKDPILQLEVVARIVASEPRAVHLFVGEGPLRGRLEAAIHVRGLTGATRVLGARSDVADLLAASDVMLLASNSEGMPGCLIEAGMVGLPVVAIGIAGVPEAVKSGRTGFIVPQGDVGGLSSSVVGLLRNRSLRHRMGQEARKWCLSRFGIKEIAGQFMGLYEELLAVGTPPRE